jgi:hypothetical protein
MLPSRVLGLPFRLEVVNSILFRGRSSSNRHPRSLPGPGPATMREGMLPILDEPPLRRPPPHLRAPTPLGALSPGLNRCLSPRRMTENTS